jgi:hypothetical protein
LRRVAKDVFAGPKGRAAARCGEASSTPRTARALAELPLVEGAEQDRKAPTPVIAAAALRADDQPPSAPELRVVGARAHRDTGLLFPLLCAAACVVVAPAFDRSSREGAATPSARTRREAAQDLGQRRGGIVSCSAAGLGVSGVRGLFAFTLALSRAESS